MPEARLARTRASLPAGYQHPTAQRLTRRYDQYFSQPLNVGESVDFTFPSWRAPHLNAAEQLHRNADVMDPFSQHRDLGDEA